MNLNHSWVSALLLVAVTIRGSVLECASINKNAAPAVFEHSALAASAAWNRGTLRATITPGLIGLLFVSFLGTDSSGAALAGAIVFQGNRVNRRIRIPRWIAHALGVSTDARIPETITLRIKEVLAGQEPSGLADRLWTAMHQNPVWAQEGLAFLEYFYPAQTLVGSRSSEALHMIRNMPLDRALARLLLEGFQPSISTPANPSEIDRRWFLRMVAHQLVPAWVLRAIPPLSVNVDAPFVPTPNSSNQKLAIIHDFQEMMANRLGRVPYYDPSYPWQLAWDEVSGSSGEQLIVNSILRRAMCDALGQGENPPLFDKTARVVGELFNPFLPDPFKPRAIPEIPSRRTVDEVVRIVRAELTTLNREIVGQSGSGLPGKDSSLMGRAEEDVLPLLLASPQVAIKIRSLAVQSHGRLAEVAWRIGVEPFAMSDAASDQRIHYYRLRILPQDARQKLEWTYIFMWAKIDNSSTSEPGGGQLSSFFPEESLNIDLGDDLYMVSIQEVKPASAFVLKQAA